MKRMVSLLLICILTLALAGCNSATETTVSGSSSNTSVASATGGADGAPEKPKYTEIAAGESRTDDPVGFQFEPPAAGEEIVVFHTSMGDIKARLFPDSAPIAVANFKALVASGYYNGLIFHRIINDFMIQGGDPKGTGIGGPGYHIKGEFAMNGVNNPLKHTYGVLSMARSMMPDSAGSQFFIMTSDSPHLDGQYAAFGKVLEGMDVADAIVSVKRDMRDKPLEPQVMKSIRVETFGQTYPFEQM